MENTINKNEYFQFINKNYFITECQKKYLVYYNNNKYKFFVENNSNKQIITFFKEASKNNNIEEITRLQLLLNHFINNKLSEKVIEHLNNKKKLYDSDIINFILKLLHNDSNNNKQNRPNNSVLLCDKWVYAIQYLALIYNNLIRIKKINMRDNKNIKYLDICCGSGKKTGIFQKNLGLLKENTYCTDIETWGPYKNKLKIPFQFKYIIDGKLDYADNSFDLCTCILSLHHIKNLSNFIKEIYRIVKPNGYFLLIDHSVYTDYDRLFINIQHLLYTVFYDKRDDYIENPDYINCYNMYEWNYIMFKHNFYLKKVDSLAFDNEFSYKYDNIFYGFYQKRL